MEYDANPTALPTDTKSETLTTESIVNPNPTMRTDENNKKRHINEVDDHAPRETNVDETIDEPPQKLTKLTHSNPNSLEEKEKTSVVSNDSIVGETPEVLNPSLKLTNPTSTISTLDNEPLLVNPSTTIELSNPETKASDIPTISSTATVNTVDGESNPLMTVKKNEKGEEKVVVDNGFVFSTTTTGVRSAATVFKGNIYKSNNHKKTTPKTYNKTNKTRGYGRFNKSVIRQQLKEGTMSLPLVAPETLAQIAKSGVPVPENIEKLMKESSQDHDQNTPFKSSEIIEIPEPKGAPVSAYKRNKLDNPDYYDIVKDESSKEQADTTGKIADSIQTKEEPSPSISTSKDDKIGTETSTELSGKKDESMNGQMEIDNNNENGDILKSNQTYNGNVQNLSSREEDTKKEEKNNVSSMVEPKSTSNLNPSLMRIEVVEDSRNYMVERVSSVSSTLSKEEEKKLKKQKKKEEKEAKAQEKKKRKEKIKQLLKETQRADSERSKLSQDSSLITTVTTFSESDKDLPANCSETVNNEDTRTDVTEEKIDAHTKVSREEKEKGSPSNPSDTITSLKSDMKDNQSIKIDATEKEKKEDQNLTITIGTNHPSNPSPRSMIPPASTSPYLRNGPMYGPPTNSSTGTGGSNFNFKNANLYNHMNVNPNTVSPYSPYPTASTPDLMYNKFHPQEAFGIQNNLQGQRQPPQQQQQRFPQGPLRQSPTLYSIPPFQYPPGQHPFPPSNPMYQQSIPPPNQFPFPRQQRQQQVYPPHRK